MSTIKLNELAESSINLSDLIAKSDANGLMTKTNIEKLANYIGAIGSSGMKAAIESTSSAPIEDGLYPCIESGTYTNFGGEVVDISGQVVFISVSDSQTVFTLVEIPLNITFDSEPTLGSTNAVESGGVQEVNAESQFLKNGLLNKSAFLISDNAKKIGLAILNADVQIADDIADASDIRIYGFFNNSNQLTNCLVLKDYTTNTVVICTKDSGVETGIITTKGESSDGKLKASFDINLDVLGSGFDFYQDNTTASALINYTKFSNVKQGKSVTDDLELKKSNVISNFIKNGLKNPNEVFTNDDAFKVSNAIINLEIIIRDDLYNEVNNDFRIKRVYNSPGDFTKITLREYNVGFNINLVTTSDITSGIVNFEKVTNEATIKCTLDLDVLEVGFDYNPENTVGLIEPKIKNTSYNLLSATKGDLNTKAIINITAEIPLATGLYYTDVTSRAAVPTEIRKKGLILTYNSAPRENKTQVYIGEDLSTVSFNSPLNWQEQSSEEVSDFISTITHNSSAPTPNRSGYYVFSSGGVCTWITGSPTVNIGDRVYVVYTSPSTYAYTLVSQSSQKSQIVTVASSQASADFKLSADYICDGTDDDVKINAAISDLSSWGGKVILSDGLFYINDTILINKAITLQGAGTGLAGSQVGNLYGTEVGITTIRAVSDVDVIVIDCTGRTPLKVQGIRMSDFLVQGIGKTTSTKIGIHAKTETDLLLIQNVNVASCFIGSFLSHPDACNIVQSSFQWNTLGMVVHTALFPNISNCVFADNNGVDDVTVDGVTHTVNTGGLAIKSFHGCITSSTFVRNDTNGTARNSVTILDANFLKFNNNTVHSQNGDGIGIEGGLNGSFAELTTIENNTITEVGKSLTTNKRNGIVNKRGHIVHIQGNTIGGGVGGTTVEFAVAEQGSLGYTGYTYVKNNVFYLIQGVTDVLLNKTGSQEQNNISF